MRGVLEESVCSDSYRGTRERGREGGREGGGERSPVGKVL